MPAGVTCLAYAGIFMYSRNLDSSDGIWEWGESYLGIPVPVLTSAAVQEGFVAACLLASFISFVEPLLPSRWSKQFRAVRKEVYWIMLDGTLS